MILLGTRLIGNLPDKNLYHSCSWSLGNGDFYVAVLSIVSIDGSTFFWMILMIRAERLMTGKQEVCSFTGFLM